MSYARFEDHDGYYSRIEETDVEMCILGRFLTDDIGSFMQFFLDWASSDQGGVTGGNSTNIEKDGDFILLTDEYPVEKFAHIVVTMRRAQFIKLLNDWKEIVCKNRPQELILRYENDEYTLEVVKV
mgnify:CR=1 FL=1